MCEWCATLIESVFCSDRPDLGKAVADVYADTIARAVETNRIFIRVASLSCDAAITIWGELPTELPGMRRGTAMLGVVDHPIQHSSLHSGLSVADVGPETLLEYGSPGASARVLLIGFNTVEPMCALIRRGCIEVTASRPGDRTEAVSTDVVIVTYAASFGCIKKVIAQARHALVPGGRLVLRLSNTPSALRDIDYRLLLNGFSLPRTWVFANGIIVCAELLLRLGCGKQARNP